MILLPSPNIRNTTQKKKIVMHFETMQVPCYVTRKNCFTNKYQLPTFLVESIFKTVPKTVVMAACTSPSRSKMSWRYTARSHWCPGSFSMTGG